MLITIGKTGTTREVAFDKLSADVKDYVVAYGLTQILNDAHSSITAKAEPDAAKRNAAVEAMVDKKLAALVAGDLRTRSVGTRDRVKAEAIRMALRAVPKDITEPKARRATAIKKVEANPAWMHLAQKHIDEADAIGEPTDLEVEDDEALAA